MNTQPTRLKIVTPLAVLAAGGMTLAACSMGSSAATTTTTTAHATTTTTARTVSSPSSTGAPSGGSAPSTLHSGTAPSGSVTSLSGSSFVVSDAGTTTTIDLVSGTTYQDTTAATVADITVGNYVEATGAVSSSGTLDATALAIVPTPPSFVATSEVTSTPSGELYFGRVISDTGGIVRITTSEGTKAISTASATTVTKTTTASLSDLKVGDTVEINGPENTNGTYDAHQINIGLQPAVVGQPGPAGGGSAPSSAG